MKILLLADNMENGGAETHIYELSRFLYQKGHFVTVLSFGGKVADALDKQGIRQIRYGASPLLTLKKALREIKPDVVHAHTRKSAFLCRVLLSFISFPFVFTAHAHFSTEPIKGALSFFPKHTIAVSEDIAKHLTRGFRVPSEQITVIKNGIDTNRFCPKEDICHNFNIVSASRLDKDCSLTALLLCRLSPALSKKISGLSITILGGGSELARVRRLAEKANLACGRDVVRVLGQKEDVLPYLQEADLFVGVSRAALEAMSCGIPVILSGNEGYLGLAVGEILPLAEQGNFCARGHRKPKADRLFRDIVSAFSDKKRLEKAKGDALRYVRVYHSAEQMAEKTLQVYRAAILDSLKSRQSDVLLCGYYGYGNLGDELTLRAIVKRLRESDGDPRQDEDEASSSKGSLPPLRISATVPRGTHYEGLVCIDRFSPVALLRAIRGTGLLILGGGSLLQNKTSNRSLLYYLSLLKIAQGLGVPTMLYAGGIGPLHGRVQIALCRSILQKTDRISVRDTSSLALLKKLGVSEARLSADPVLFCHTPQRTPEDYILAFIRREESTRFLDFFRNQSHPIRLAVMDRACDLSATKRLARILRKHGKEVTVCELSSMEDLFKQIGGARLVISARLHALILAFCMGVPFVGLSDDPKITSFVRTAYDGVLCPVTREVIAEHFRGKRRQQLALAQTDAETAIALTKRKLFP